MSHLLIGFLNGKRNIFPWFYNLKSPASSILVYGTSHRMIILKIRLSHLIVATVEVRSISITRENQTHLQRLMFCFRRKTKNWGPSYRLRDQTRQQKPRSADSPTKRNGEKRNRYRLGKRRLEFIQWYPLRRSASFQLRPVPPRNDQRTSPRRNPAEKNRAEPSTLQPSLGHR
ncbi:Uncharacterized protein HZ326_11409 [Fusarium oxysporum f. sp. albedinis]|nr:Uncharacterized protein HZ326_11409 [Fusarium oxysporum f. sp. albedinis]